MVPKDIVAVSHWGLVCEPDVLSDAVLSHLHLEVVLGSSGPGFRQCLPC